MEAVQCRDNDGSTGHSAHLAAHLAAEVPSYQPPPQHKHPVVSRREAVVINSVPDQGHVRMQVSAAGRVRRMASEQSLLPAGASGVSSAPDAGTGSTTVVDGVLPTRQSDLEANGATGLTHVRELLVGAEAAASPVNGATTETGSQGCELMMRLSQLSDKVERLAQAMARLDTREDHETL
eukprot:3343944-Amphidinium_carterae.1